MFNHIKCHASIELTVEVGPGLNAVEYYVFNGAFILFFFLCFLHRISGVWKQLVHRQVTTLPSLWLAASRDILGAGWAKYTSMKKIKYTKKG